jgi:predicted PurR-regulated permease PerM
MLPGNIHAVCCFVRRYSLVLLAAILFVFVMAFRLLSPIILSFVLIILVTLAINPVVRRLRNLTGTRKAAVMIIIGAFVVLACGTALAFFAPIKSSVSQLVQRAPEYWERLQKPLIRMEQRAVLSEAKIAAEVRSEEAKEKPGAPPVNPSPPPPTVETAPKPGSIRSGLTGMLQGASGGVASIVFDTAETLIVLITVFFGVVFSLLNPRPLFSTILSFIPAPHHDRAMTVLQRIGEFVPNWAMATLLGMLIIGTLVFLVMWPIFGFADALILGVIAAVLEAVPYLGPILAAVPALLLGLGQGGFTPLWVLLAYSIIQALENNVILPLVMARTMKLHPVAVIFSMLICVVAFGVLGVLIAAPMVAIIGIFHDELFRKRFLPSVSDRDLDTMARKLLRERTT